ncbi:MAG: carbamate kinase [Actinomycetota bacterium]
MDRQTDRPRVVVALGGNALLRVGEEDTFQNAYRAARRAAERIAAITATGRAVVVPPATAPPVGPILLQLEAAASIVHPMPLDVCGAESQGQIGYLLQATIGDVFYERGMPRPVVTVLTMTRVRRDDPAFAEPTKPVGPFYDEDEATKLAAERGWTMRADAHGGFRRVVPSPAPYSIVEAPVIADLVASGAIVIAAGGGGVPVVEDGPTLVGVEGVVDKDLAAAILARDVAAAELLILTDVERVQIGFGTPAARAIEEMTVAEARGFLAAGEFGAGSMKPKVEAAVSFLERGGERATIAALERATEALAGRAGTRIVP